MNGATFFNVVCVSSASQRHDGSWDIDASHDSGIVCAADHHDALREVTQRAAIPVDAVTSQILTDGMIRIGVLIRKVDGRPLAIVQGVEP